MSAFPNRAQTIQRLARQLRAWERGNRRADLPVRPSPEDGLESPSYGGIDGPGGPSYGAFSTGIAPLDELLPDGGLHAGSLLEWLSAAEGSGAGTLAFRVAGHLLRSGGACLVIDREGRFYPPAAGFSADALRRTVVVHPASDGDALWALEQSLRCPGAIVVGWLGRLHANAYRRLQLAAETGGGIGLLLRDAAYRSHPSWADVRVRVEAAAVKKRKAESGKRRETAPGFPLSAFGFPQGRRLRLEVLHCRGRAAGGGVELEIDHETGDVRLAPPLAAATDSLRAAGA